MGLSWDKTGPVCFRNRSDWLSPEKATSGKKDVNSHLREGDWWLLELQEVIWRRNKRIDRSSHKTSREHRLYRNPAKSWHGFSKGVLDTVSNYLGSFLRGYCFSLMLALNSGLKGAAIHWLIFFPLLLHYVSLLLGGWGAEDSPDYRALIITHFETVFQHLLMQTDCYTTCNPSNLSCNTPFRSKQT